MRDGACVFGNVVDVPCVRRAFRVCGMVDTLRVFLYGRILPALVSARHAVLCLARVV